MRGLLIGAAAWLGAAALALAQTTAQTVPRLIPFSGQVTAATGQPATEPATLIFAIYEDQTGGAALWVEIQPAELDAQGRYTALLGATTDGVPQELFATNAARWLGVRLQGQAEQPRVQLVSVPYALKAVEAETLAGRAATDFVLVDRVSDTVKAVLEAEAAAGWRAPGQGAPGVVTSGFEGGAPLYNTFYGTSAGAAGPTGASNAFFGADAGPVNTTGTGNSFFGRWAGYSNTSGGSNTFVGYSAGYYNTGAENTFVGYGAGVSNSDGSNNTYVGYIAEGAAGITNATAIGFRAKVTRSNSLVLGSIAGENSATANTNVGIGTTSPGAVLDVQAAQPHLRVMSKTGTSYVVLQLANNAGSGFVGIDRSAGGALATGTLPYAVSVIAPAGRAVHLAPNNTVALTATSGGNVGIGTTVPTQPLQMGSGAYVSTGGVWTNASSRTLKDQIADLPASRAQDALARLKPVTFVYKATPGEAHVGFIAEEVPDLVATADRRGLAAMDVVAVLTKVVQMQQEELDRQAQRLDAQAQELIAQRATTAELRGRLAWLEALLTDAARASQVLAPRR